MTDTTSRDELKLLIDKAQTILILQPDSPDGDSIGSALGLEEILGDLGKTVLMYSYKEPETYLHSLEGWDRVLQDMPNQYDATILVDTASPRLIKSTLDKYSSQLMAKPFGIIDHHTTQDDFGFKTVTLVEPAAATAEIITSLALEWGWTINPSAASKLASAIISDSLNLTTGYTTARTVRMLAEVVERGADLFELYKIKRENSALSPELMSLKGELLSSTRYLCDGRLAVAVIQPDIVKKFQDDYETYNLIINDLQWTKGVQLVAVYKNYGTKINVPMRSAVGIAGPIAELFGGGGHLNAAAYRCETTDVEAEIEKLALAVTRYLAENRVDEVTQ